MTFSQIGPDDGNETNEEREDDEVVERFDHDCPPTHEEEQERQAELGAPKAEGGKKKGKKAKTPKAPKEPKAPKAKKPRKPKAEKPAKGPGRGIRADGKPRRKPGTNPPKSEEAAKYGRKVAKLREAMGWTQAVLAEKCGFGQPTIANIERGTIPAGERKINGEPSAKARLAKALKEPSLGPKE